MIAMVVLIVMVVGGVLGCLPAGKLQAAFVEPVAGPASSNQDFVENIMGADNADNAFDSSTVGADADGSLIERLEYIITAIASLWTKAGTILYYDSGNVGIGTSTPSVLLEVSGTGQQGIKVTDETSGIVTGIWAGTAQGLIGTYTNTDLRLITNGTSKMTIEADGNVGIASTSPFYKFSMNSGTSGFGIDSSGIVQQGTWNGTAIDFSDYTNATASTNITFTDDAISVTDPFSVTNLTATYASTTAISSSGGSWLATGGGNVGIGTTSPAYELDVAGDVHLTGTIYQNYSALVTGYFTQVSDDIYYSSGNVGIGTTSLSTYALNVHGSLYADDIYTSGSTFYMGGNPLLTRTSGTLDFGVETGENIDFTINDTSAFYVKSDGNVGIGTTSPTVALEINGNVIADVPTADNHLATKAYVDAAASISKTELWPDGTTCTAGIINQLGWNAGAGAMTYCDGSNWIVEGTGCGNSVAHGGQDYATVQIGTQCWFAENLNIGTKLAAGTTEPADNGTIEKWCYDNSDANCTADGGFYNWDEAMQYTETAGAQGICPSGWHIPTDSEQDALDQYFATGTCNTSRSGAYDCDPAGTALKEGGSSGFEGVLSGGRNTNGSFSSLDTNTDFWSSSVSGANAWRRGLNVSLATVRRHPYDQALGFSIRCLKN